MSFHCAAWAGRLSSFGEQPHIGTFSVGEDAKNSNFYDLKKGNTVRRGFSSSISVKVKSIGAPSNGTVEKSMSTSPRKAFESSLS